MVLRYLNRKTSYFYNNATGSSRSMVLIYGDALDTSGVPDLDSSARIEATFRGRTGFIQQNRLMTDKPLELYFIDVGQGDSTFIITPGGRKILVDGGENRRAVGFLAWLYRLDDPASTVDIDLLILSHADGDHIDGLVPIVTHPQITVHEIVHNGLATFRGGAHDLRIGDLDAGRDHVITWHDQLAELAPDDLSDSFLAWRQAILAEGAAYRAVDSFTGMLDVGDPDVELDVLGPRYVELADGSFGLPWFDSGTDHAHTINGHSVVARLTYRDVSLFLSGDLNVEGSEYLRADPAIGARMSAHILKCPHHGSHEFDLGLLEAVAPQISAVSSGDGPDHGHPRANFLAALGRASRSPEPLLFSTEIAATFIESAEDELDPDEVTTMEDLDFSVSEHNATARKLFKQRLPGMINVRTDGRSLHAARRVNQGYWWESYGPMNPAGHPTVFS